MGEGQWFADFCSALRIGKEKRESVGYRTGRIVGQLNADLRNLVSQTAYRFYVGSYGRITAIPTVSDVDLIYELPPSLYERFNGHSGNGQSALLAYVRSSIQKTYPSSAVAGDGQVVAINFTDGIRFEVLPAFSNVAATYTFADSNGGGCWRECKPKQEMAAFSKRNTDCNGNLVELCRMARAWRDYNGVDMSGMLIDTLAYQFIVTWAYRDKSYLYYDYLTRDFFNYLAGIDLKKTYWQAPGSGSYVRRGNAFQFKARSAELRALEAIKHQSAGYNWSARQKYREIYGTAFQNEVPNVMPLATLEGQLREMYGRAAYTHKTHEKMADQCTTRYKGIKLAEIGLSAIASGSFILALLGDSHAATIVGAAVSTILLGITLYFKEDGVARLAQTHTEVAAKLWAVRESLLSLLVDMNDGVELQNIRARRDELNATLEAIYRSAPRTNDKAYRAAQRALRDAEELYFADEELDHLLPPKLRQAGKEYRMR